MTADASVDDRRAVLSRRIRLLVAVTISYNVVEAVAAISAGTVASSVALIGFGLDSPRRRAGPGRPRGAGGTQRPAGRPVLRSAFPAGDRDRVRVGNRLAW